MRDLCECQVEVCGIARIVEVCFVSAFVFGAIMGSVKIKFNLAMKFIQLCINRNYY